MRLLEPLPNGMFPVMELCSTTRRFIQNLPQAKRYLVNTIWYVHRDYLPILFKVAKNTGFHTELNYATADDDTKRLIDKTLNKRVTSPTYSTAAYSALHLLPSAPFSVVKAVWKVLALESHPDRGGDAKNFQRVTDAYEQIKNSYTGCDNRGEDKED